MKYLAILLLSGLSAWGQVTTNLQSQLLSVWNNLPPEVRAATIATWQDYSKAARQSDEFAGVAAVTNLVVVDGITNSVVVATTNNPPLSFVQFFQAALTQDKITRVVYEFNAGKRAEMYLKVGKTVVDAWNP